MLSSKVQSFFPSFTNIVSKNKEEKNNNTLGNVTFAKSVVSIKNTCVYRADTRSPETVRKHGFSGTKSIDPLEVRVFGEKTVFASASKAGVDKFIKSDGFHTDERFCHIYKIKTGKHKVFSFSENFKRNPSELIEGISRLAIKELGLSPEEARRWTTESIRNDYLAVDELQIEGPVNPKFIEHIETVKML